MKKTLAFVDLETTGLDPNKHEIIEAAIILSRADGSTYEWQSKIKPKDIASADPVALKVNGYIPEEWDKAPLLEEVSSEITSLLEGTMPVAHNAHFDRSFLETHLGVDTLPHRWLDTISIAHVVMPNRDRYSLASLCDAFGIDNSGAHTALVDARRCLRLYESLMNKQKEIL